jgi:hypothetical protein
MENINKFGSDITSFRNGTLDYKYNFNSAGNLFFKENSDVFNENFLKILVKNSGYDVSKLAKLYNLSFEEFKSSDQSSDQSPSKETNVSVSLEKKLVDSSRLISELKSQISSSSSTNSDDAVYKLRSELKASRDTIVELRISAGEGESPEDFGDEFPFYLKKDTTIPIK